MLREEGVCCGRRAVVLSSVKSHWWGAQWPCTGLSHRCIGLGRQGEPPRAASPCALPK